MMMYSLDRCLPLELDTGPVNCPEFVILKSLEDETLQFCFHSSPIGICALGKGIVDKSPTG